MNTSEDREGVCTRDDCGLPTRNDDVCWWCRNEDAGTPLT